MAASYANLVKSRLGVVGQWRFNETSGTTATDKTATANGTYTGAPTLGVVGALADADLAVTLNGTTQYITMGSVAALKPTASVSVGAIVNPTVVNVARQSLAGCGSTAKGYLLCLENATPKFYVNGTPVVSTVNIIAGTWVMLTGTFDGTTAKIYINGILCGSQAIAGPIDFTGITNFIVGQRDGLPAGEYFNGTVDEVAVFSRALTQREITQHQDGRVQRGFAYSFHAERNGINNGWTDLTQDLMGEDAGNFGLPGSTVRDRVAATGQLKTVLNNSSTNQWGLDGAYSPDHVNKIAGWDYGIRVRYAVTALQRTFYLHVGTIDDMVVMAGKYEDRTVVVTSLDYMDELARANVTNVPVQVNQSDSAIFTALIASVPKQPSNLQVGTGLDTFAYALDNVQDEQTKLISVLSDLAMSALAYIYVQSTTSGDTLVYEPRSVRAATNTDALDTFVDTEFQALDLDRGRRNAVNRVKVISHPKTIDAAPTTIVFTLNNPLAIPPHNTVTLYGLYTDPTTKNQRIGATNVQALTKVTDYKANSASDGTGADLTNNIDASATVFYGNAAQIILTNNGDVTAYVGGATAGAYLKVRGKGIYDYTPAQAQAEDTDSQAQAGLNQVTIDMIYQSDPGVANEVAFYIVNIFKSPRTKINKIGFFCPSNNEVLAERLLRRQISDRIGIQETMSGLKTTTNHFIQSVKWTNNAANCLSVEWLLAPSDQTQYWLLEIVGRSELDQTTVLGFGLIVGHTDVAHGDSHGDVAHGDVVHTDTHTDDAHQDVAHGDGATHGDTAHSDVAHGDVVHSDVSHGDVAHSDVLHLDTAHGDSHSDVAHDDVAHGDATTHSDHDDAPGKHLDADHHTDSHTDIAHSDDHTDVAHQDLAHSDSHTDSAHSDVAHTDTAHVDVAHSDAAGHADSAHVDTAHGDVAHADVAHSDIAHSDVHTDTAHGDAN